MLLKKTFRLNSVVISVPGDKSLSHRFVIFASLAKGKSECTGFLEAEDPLHTMECFRKLGVSFQKTGPGRFQAESPGLGGLKSPDSVLDFGNGGTGIRLSCGLLAGIPGLKAELTGDASLQKRPMNRILEPLVQMGAKVRSQKGDGKAPLEVEGERLKDFRYTSKIASAQVKSCLIFAALASGVRLEYSEPELSRDHTENMIRFLGGKIEQISETQFVLNPPYNFTGKKFHIPGDISSAAFFIVLGLLGESGSVLKIKNIGLNPSRIGILEVLRSMGGRIETENLGSECGEVTGDLLVYGSELTKTLIPKHLIPSIIDEIPILTIAGLFSKGGFEIREAEELRAKESDRIHSMVSNLQKMGVQVEEFPDGYRFGEVDSSADSLKKAEIETFMDHRIAMSFSVLDFVHPGKVNIDDRSWVETSFPGFFDLLEGLRGDRLRGSNSDSRREET
jgi:3-phosphoshikimate 1-carboxyvinyltransferase